MSLRVLCAAVVAAAVATVSVVVADNTTTTAGAAPANLYASLDLGINSPDRDCFLFAECNYATSKAACEFVFSKDGKVCAWDDAKKSCSASTTAADHVRLACIKNTAGACAQATTMAACRDIVENGNMCAWDDTPPGKCVSDPSNRCLCPLISDRCDANTMGDGACKDRDKTITACMTTLDSTETPCIFYGTPTSTCRVGNYKACALKDYVPDCNVLPDQASCGKQWTMNPYVGFHTVRCVWGFSNAPDDPNHTAKCVASGTPGYLLDPTVPDKPLPEYRCGCRYGFPAAGHGNGNGP